MKFSRVIKTFKKGESGIRSCKRIEVILRVMFKYALLKKTLQWRRRRVIHLTTKIEIFVIECLNIYIKNTNLVIECEVKNVKYFQNSLSCLKELEVSFFIHFFVAFYKQNLSIFRRQCSNLLFNYILMYKQNHWLGKSYFNYNKHGIITILIIVIIKSNVLQ